MTLSNQNPEQTLDPTSSDQIQEHEALDFSASALADREAELVEEELAARPVDEPVAFSGPPPSISNDAFALIVRHETGGRPFYERVIRKRPVWPAGSSGVTIGFGYDLGFVGERELRRDWGVLGDAALDRLASACGKNGAKHPKAEMKALTARFSDIIVEWEAAEAVFRARTLPKFVALTAAALPNVDQLSADSFGALVSLTFNRGASFSKAHVPAKDPLDRFREMRAIKAAMADRDFIDIGDLIRAMIRIWRGTAIETEMTRRRKNEGALFDHGLASGRAVFMPSFSLGAADEDDAFLHTDTSDEDNAPDGDEAMTLEEGLSFATAITAANVRWADDATSPDYAHQPEAPPPGGRFRLDAVRLEALAAANDFDLPDDARILFGLRGCAVVEAGDGFEPSVLLRDIRPDHQTARCVMGVWDRAGGRVAAYPASTVPNSQAVVSWRTLKNQGNLLPTGLYGYIVGPHNGKPGCFLLRETIGQKRRVVVRRSSADLAYSVDDLIDACEPGDNIHPSFAQTTALFSSVGCQVVVGSAKPTGNHNGPWAKFREAAGLRGDNGTIGQAFTYMLLTAAEAAIPTQPGRRLRFGSSGPRVDALQRKLELAGPDGKFGPKTAEALHRLQRRLRANRSDGIFTPQLDTELGWGIFPSA